MTVGFELQHQMNKPYTLNGFSECLRRFVGNLIKDPAHFEQLRFPCRICFAGRGFFGQSRISSCKASDRLNDNKNPPIEIALFNILIVGQIKSVQFFLCPAFVILQTDTKHLPVVDRAVRVSRCDVPFRFDNSEIVIESRMRRKRGKSSVEERIVFPEGRDFTKLFFVFFCYIENVAVAVFEFVELVDDPFHRVFRKDRRAPVRGGLIPGDQRFRLDEDAHSV